MKRIDPTTVPDRNCVDEDLDTFFPQPADLKGSWAAKRICAGCPALDVCLEYALAVEDGVGVTGRHGIWGGMSGRQRALIATQRRKRAVA